MQSIWNNPRWLTAIILFLLGLLLLLVFLLTVQPPSHADYSDKTLPPPALSIGTINPTLEPDLQAELVATPLHPPTAAPTIETPAGVYTFLLLGVDRRTDQAGKPARTDTIMLLRVDFDNRNASLLSFPRDIWLPIADLNYYEIYEQRINAAYFFGEKYDMPGGGIEILRRTIWLNFGVPVDRYMLINFETLVNTVDALGGIEMYVSKEINDFAIPVGDYGSEKFHLDVGWHDFDGVTALKYARTRHQDSDTERIKRQQEVLLAIFKKVLSVDGFSRLPEFYSAMQGGYETDITLDEALWFGQNSQGITPERVKRYAIGQDMLVAHVTNGGAHVWIPKMELITPLMFDFAQRYQSP
ncbi:MAG TPA: LCP family protein [Anaerolineales bacterium]|nr:LCP family protein [Anaerolineales bacterium]